MQVGLAKNYSNKLTNIHHHNIQHNALLQTYKYFTLSTNMFLCTYCGLGNRQSLMSNVF